MPVWYMDSDTRAWSRLDRSRSYESDQLCYVGFGNTSVSFR